MTGFRIGFSANSGTTGVTTQNYTIPTGTIASDTVWLFVVTATSTSGTPHTLNSTTGSGTLSVPTGAPSGRAMSTLGAATLLSGTGHVAGDVLTIGCPASGITTGNGAVYDNTVVFDLCGTQLTSSATTTQTIPSVTTTVNGSLAVAFVAGIHTATRNVNSVSPGTLETSLNGAGGNTRWTAFGISDQTITTAGASGTVAFVFSGAISQSAGVQVAMKPAGGAFNSTAALTETATITPAAVVGVNSGATLTSTATVTPAATVGASSGASLNVTTTITPTGAVGVASGAAVNTAATVTSAAVVGVSSGATVSTAATITAAASVSGAGLNAAATLTTAAAITPAAVVGVQSGAAATTAAAIAATGVVGAQAGASIAATAGITPTAVVGTNSGAARSTTATVTVTAALGYGTTAAVNIAVTVTATATVNTQPARDITVRPGPVVIGYLSGTTSGPSYVAGPATVDYTSGPPTT